MTDDDQHIAIEARTSARFAHDRLDRMNGSIDKLRDVVNQGNKEAAAANAATDAKIDQVLQKLARDEGQIYGSDATRRSVLDSRRFVISTGIAMLCSGTFVALLTLALKGHI